MYGTLKISEQARKDLDHFRAYDTPTYKNCYVLSKAVSADPFDGPGKPQNLGECGKNVWCRRTSLENRMVYEVFATTIVVAAFRSHVE